MSAPLAILGPVFALAAWTLTVLLLIAIRRTQATNNGSVRPEEYAFGDSPNDAASTLLASRNYMNLLELPVLFYVACLMSVVVGASSSTMLALAWLYFGLRVVHSLIHLTYNRIIHRFAVFALSNAVLVALWVVIGLQIVDKSSG
jgi:hypothetical protein